MFGKLAHCSRAISRFFHWDSASEASLVMIVPSLTLVTSAGVSGEPWFNPPGGTWVPDAAMVSDFKVALEPMVVAALAAQSGPVQPPARYWLQYVGEESAGEKVIALIGYLSPVSPNASKEYLNGSVPEKCLIHAEYWPRIKKVMALGVGPACPPRL